MLQLRQTNSTFISAIQRTSSKRHDPKRSPRQTRNQKILLPSTNPRANRHFRVSQQIQKILMKDKFILPFNILISTLIFGIFISNEYIHIRIISILFLLLAMYSQYLLSKKTTTIHYGPKGTIPPKNASEGDSFIQYKK